jgi:EmrB/QacA subfamily drug resistance transporter
MSASPVSAVGDSPVYARRWWALAVLSLSVVVIGMDLLILNVALPTLTRDLGATTSDLQWIIDAYAVAFAGLLLAMGALADRFGRRRILDIGLLIFVASSVAAAWSQSPEMLIAARAAMGVGSAMIMPATLSTVTAIFPESERGRAIGVWAAMAGIGLVVGPAIGGWLLDNFWWGAVFLVNVPVVAVALIAGRLLVPESRDRTATPLDPFGAVLSTAGLSLLVFAVIEAPDEGWSDPLIVGALVAGAVLVAAFLWWQVRARHPMLHLDLFRDRRFSAASATLMLATFAMFGTIFLLTQYLQFVLGYTALETGWRVMPVAALALGAPLGTRISERVGTKIVVAVGLLIVAGGLWRISAVEPGDGYAPIGWALAAVGVGIGATVAPATDSIMGSVPPDRTGVGSATNSTTRQIGGALGVAVLGSVLSSVYRDQIAPAVQDQPAAASEAAQDSVGAALALAQGLGPAGSQIADAARAAFADAVSAAVLVAAGVALLGAAVAAAALPARSTHPTPAKR